MGPDTCYTLRRNTTSRVVAMGEGAKGAIVPLEPWVQIQGDVKIGHLRS